MNYHDIVVLIPAYKPDERLIALTDELIKTGFDRLVVVDDGGGEAYAHIFKALEGKAKVLTHPVNRGKGAALKTGLKAISNMRCAGVVTADCDGQHAPKDIARIADALLAEPEALILGSRDKKQMPLRSKCGNTLTCAVFGFLTNLWISDTQTGLRGLPASQLSSYANLKGDRYEYEQNMLIRAAEEKTPVKEVTIETIYIDNNSGSHFNALRDGLKIYGLMFREAGKFALASLLSTLLDFLLFTVLLNGFHQTRYVSQIGARIVSAVFNYTLNSRVVFGKKVSGMSFAKYALLAVFILGCSLLGHKLFELIGVSPIPSKLIVDGLLYIVSFRVQKLRIFAKEKEAAK